MDRHPFGGGDYLTRFPEGAAYRLQIDAPFEKPGWQARQPGDATHATFPGTAILFEGSYFEVVKRGRSRDGRWWMYLLNPWDPSHPIRNQAEYSVQACEALARARRQQRQDRQAGLTLTYLSPLVSLLPARDQERLANELDFPAVRGTLIGALGLWIASSIVGVLGMASSFSPRPMPDLQWAQTLLPFALYFNVESIVRFIVAFRMDEPMGSLPVWLPVETVRAFRQSVDPQARLAAARRRTERRRGSEPFKDARDTVQPVRGGEIDLEITSLLPKPHWTANQTAIYFNDRCYNLVERKVRDQPDGPRHLFYLREVREETFFKQACKYDPEEVRRLFREQRRDERRTWVETFAPLWGFLDPESQLHLQEVYGYEPLRSTLMSLIASAVVGAVAVYSAGGAIEAGPVRLVDVLILLLGLYLLGEAGMRLYHYTQGRVTGSALFGRLLHPIGARLFE